MLQMCLNDSEYKWSSIFEFKKKEALTNIDYKSVENDVFKELTLNIQKTQGRCIDEQFDLAIMSLNKSLKYALKFFCVFQFLIF